MLGELNVPVAVAVAIAIAEEVGVIVASTDIWMFRVGGCVRALPSETKLPDGVRMVFCTVFLGA